MADHRLWCWDLAQSRAGPDWLLIAHVAAEHAGALADLASRADLEGFAPCDDGDGHTFIDASNRAAYAGNLAGGAQQNIWVYNLVRVYGDTIEVECGYGGRGESLNRAETAFLLDILAAPTITLRSWRVLAGGNGYDFRALREGDSGESLRAYLSPTGA
jgi:hypothetical protein